MKTAVALGNFDGVHIAHTKLIEAAVNKAQADACKSVVYMFETHPRIVLGDRDFKVITDNARKAGIIKALGADEVVYEKTTAQMLALSPDEFARDVLKGRLRASFVTAGYNYRFGKDGSGTSEDLVRLGKKYGFEVKIIDKVTYAGQDISSSLLREYISNGEVDKANAVMCRPYAVCGFVSEGKKLGRQWGIETANIAFSDAVLVPKHGVYMTKTLYRGMEYKSVTNIGINPTVEGTKPRSETHILDFSGDLYGEYLEIEFFEIIRPEIKFGSAGELKEQIKKDIEYVKNGGLY